MRLLTALRPLGPMSLRPHTRNTGVGVSQYAFTYNGIAFTFGGVAFTYGAPS